MKLPALAAAALALAGCVVVPVERRGPPPPGPVAAPVVWYHGPHFIPEDQGGGWCYEEGAHTHDYFPDDPDVYVVERGYYTYAGPSVFLYLDGHPLPGGGWCYIQGPHRHEYYPPPRAGFFWDRGHGYVYRGEWRPSRPPPPAYWPRPTVWYRSSPPQRLPSVPAPVYRPPPGRPAPGVRPPPPQPPDRRDPPARLDDRDRGHREPPAVRPADPIPDRRERVVSPPGREEPRRDAIKRDEPKREELRVRPGAEDRRGRGDKEKDKAKDEEKDDDGRDGDRRPPRVH